MSETKIEEACGCWLATAEDEEDQMHHWWIDETDEGHVVVAAQVVHYGDGQRKYLDSVSPPSFVVSAIRGYFDAAEIYDVDGRPL